jgi:hypothetical protein
MFKYPGLAGMSNSDVSVFVFFLLFFLLFFSSRGISHVTGQFPVSPVPALTVKTFVFCLQSLLVSLGKVLVSIQILNRLPSIIFLQWVDFPDH